ncbi:MAG: hypothetical protein O2999_04285 [Nitrospirae bacterium]|nr:hypothetical protein [Nitrospirota bacterium]MDA1303507.1 hypothetical protein [Nitrospirota bacterium]
MTPEFSMPLPSASFRPWALLFAQDADKDLDFDDGLDDLDDLDPKPPSRRPLLLILLLLLVAGVGYFMMDPGAFSSLTSMVMAPASKTHDPAAETTTSDTHEEHGDSLPHAPTPSFQEGQLVAVASLHSGETSMKLSGDPQGKDPGPSVKTGELLTILDGTIIGSEWIYLVHTKSGASGWIGEHQLKTQS